MRFRDFAKQMLPLSKVTRRRRLPGQPKRQRTKSGYHLGETVRIIAGPFRHLQTATVYSVSRAPSYYHDVPEDGLIVRVAHPQFPGRLAMFTTEIERVV